MDEGAGVDEEGEGHIKNTALIYAARQKVRNSKLKLGESRVGSLAATVAGRRSAAGSVNPFRSSPFRLRAGQKVNS